jgi:hypothetical protein
MHPAQFQRSCLAARSILSVSCALQRGRKAIGVAAQVWAGRPFHLRLDTRDIRCRHPRCTGQQWRCGRFPPVRHHPAHSRPPRGLFQAQRSISAPGLTPARSISLTPPLGILRCAPDTRDILRWSLRHIGRQCCHGRSPLVRCHSSPFGPLENFPQTPSAFYGRADAAPSGRMGSQRGHSPGAELSCSGWWPGNLARFAPGRGARISR